MTKETTMPTLAQIDLRNKTAAELAEHARQIDIKAAQVRSDVISRRTALDALKAKMQDEGDLFTAEEIAEVDAAKALLTQKVVDLATELQ